LSHQLAPLADGAGGGARGLLAAWAHCCVAADGVAEGENVVHEPLRELECHFLMKDIVTSPKCRAHPWPYLTLNVDATPGQGRHTVKGLPVPPHLHSQPELFSIFTLTSCIPESRWAHVMNVRETDRTTNPQVRDVS
jgi:hypothetical protein